MILEAAQRRLLASGPEAIRLQEIAADVGDALFGPLLRRGMGLPDEAGGRQFRAWLLRFLTGLVFVPAPERKGTRRKSSARER